MVTTRKRSNSAPPRIQPNTAPPPVVVTSRPRSKTLKNPNTSFEQKKGVTKERKLLLFVPIKSVLPPMEKTDLDGKHKVVTSPLHRKEDGLPPEKKGSPEQSKNGLDIGKVGSADKVEQDLSKGIDKETYQKLYHAKYKFYPALRFHKDTKWRETLRRKKQFGGDAYTLREKDYDPYTKVMDKRKAYKKKNPGDREMPPNKMNHEGYQPSDAHTLKGYNEGLKATVEASISRNLSKNGAPYKESKTIGDMIQKLKQAGPLLIVDGKKDSYEKYEGNSVEHWSFGKLGKKHFQEKDVLNEIPVITGKVEEELDFLKKRPVTSDIALGIMRGVIVKNTTARVTDFLQRHVKKETEKE